MYPIGVFSIVKYNVEYFSQVSLKNLPTMHLYMKVIGFAGIKIMIEIFAITEILLSHLTKLTIFKVREVQIFF